MIPAKTEAKARAFADQIIAERAPAGEAIDALQAFTVACRYVGSLAIRKRDDRRLASWERGFWEAVRAHASAREIAATNAALAAYDAAQAGK